MLSISIQPALDGLGLDTAAKTTMTRFTNLKPNQTMQTELILAAVKSDAVEIAELIACAIIVLASLYFAHKHLPKP